MGKLEKLTEAGHRVLISGPYGTEVNRRFVEAIDANWQKLHDIRMSKLLGPDGSALLSEEGREYLSTIASDYAEHSPTDQPLVILTPTFRMVHRFLYGASRDGVFSPLLPTKGLDFCREAVDLCVIALERARHPDSMVGMSIGPPFDCYKGEEAPSGVGDLYLPQTIAAVRFAPEVDILVFETIPTFKTARGAARAFTNAHKGFNVSNGTGDINRVEVIEYLGNRLQQLVKHGHTDVQPVGYDKGSKSFDAIAPRQDYVISLCVEEDGRLYNTQLDRALNNLYVAIEKEKLHAPLGIGINCNSPDLTREAIEKLSPENRDRIISTHPNASSERDPRRYGLMTTNQNIPPDIYTKHVAAIVKDFGLKVFGGCCGTNHYTLNGLAQAVKQ